VKTIGSIGQNGKKIISSSFCFLGVIYQDDHSFRLKYGQPIDMIICLLSFA
jgi:hypothetical protein